MRTCGVKRLLLDTSAYIQMVDGDDRVFGLLAEAEGICLSAVALGELLAGCPAGKRWEARRAALDDFLTVAGAQVLPLAEATAAAYAQLFNHARERGRMMPTNDLWIAASALEHDLTILTADRHFADLPVGCLLLD
jgi:tRNA(fMet)-specific endonuclease VapC